jgi:uncharacterized protein
MPLTVLPKSPLDSEPPRPEIAIPGTSRWVPSRYNVRATMEDGRLILWNSLNGSLSVFKTEQAERVRLLLRKTGIDSQPNGMAKYLFDRGFLIKDGLNEYRQVQLAFGQQHYRTDILQLILLASEDCNFRCQYCYEDFARGTMQPEVRESIKRLLTKRIGGLKKLQINWFGGEPLYGYEAIEDLAPFFHRIAKENSVSLKSNITTNAYLLTPEVAESLLGWGVTFYQITVDGRPEDHDHNRPTRDGGGTFATILENLKSLKTREEDYSVVLRVNFDRQNHPYIPEFLDILQRELGNDPRFLLKFHSIGRWGGENDAQLDVCGADEAMQVRFDLRREAMRRGLNIGQGLKDVSGMGAEACYAARPTSFVVGASGKLMKCTVSLDKQDANVIGRVTPEGELEIDRDKFALWTEPAFENDGRCKKCVVLPSCQGLHCPLIRIEENRSPCMPIRLHLKESLIETHDIVTAIGRPKRVSTAVS